MVGSIDPRREALRAIQWPCETAALFGPLAAETILASGLIAAPTGRTHGSKRSDPKFRTQTSQAGGRPHMDCFAAGAARNDETEAAGESAIWASGMTVDQNGRIVGLADGIVW
jgi:hypothetical protein